MDIRTPDGFIEAFAFLRDSGSADVDEARHGLANAPGMRFVGEFVGDFALLLRVESNDLSQLRGRIRSDYRAPGMRAEWAISLTGSYEAPPRRPLGEGLSVCALVRVQVTDDPFSVLDALGERFLGREGYGAAVVTARDFDILVNLDAASIEEATDRVLDLRSVHGIGRTATAIGDLAETGIWPAG